MNWNELQTINDLDKTTQLNYRCDCLRNLLNQNQCIIIENILKQINDI